MTSMNFRSEASWMFSSLASTHDMIATSQNLYISRKKGCDPWNGYYLVLVVESCWTNTFEKYARQIGSFAQVGMKIKNI